MKKQDFLNAGFTESEDPQFKFEYSLKKENEEYENDGPAILFDVVMNQFCITDGEVMFIYFNAETPAEAVEWANKVTHFELN